MKRKILFMLATSLLFTMAWRAQALPCEFSGIDDTAATQSEKTLY